MEYKNNEVTPLLKEVKAKKTFTPSTKETNDMKTIMLGNSQINYSPRSGTAITSIVLSDPDCKPYYADEGSSGADIFAYIEEPVTIKPLERVCIPTGIKVAIPNGSEIQIRPRSGLALRNGITVLNTPGTIDSSYRGEIKVLLINLGDKDFVVEPRMRIAQAVCTPIKRMYFSIKTEKEFEEDYSTLRGSGGFGSTGV